MRSPDSSRFASLSSVPNPEDLPAGARRVAQFLLEARAEARIDEFAGGTPTAEDAARAAGCGPNQIVKSLVFVCDGAPIVVLIPGDRRADRDKVGQAAGCRRVKVASPREVEEATGFRPGSVAPFPLPDVDAVLIDQTLLAEELVWAGAGSPHHLVVLAPAELVRLARARSVDAVAPTA